MAQPFSLIWKDVTFTPQEPIFQKIMNSLTCGICFKGKKEKARKLIPSKGVINQGELVALMGPSGAGKSTLLKCLTLGKNYTGFNGTIIVKGLPDNVQVRAGSISQHEKEHLIMELTVAESLRYASMLKNGKATKEQHEQYVEQYMEYLGISGNRNSKVEKCSGGQRKRLAVGLELIAVEKPHFLFLDEPTSGLDSYLAENLVRFLAECAHQYEMTIITTIHQPKQSVFECYSKVFVLAGDSSIVYNLDPKYLPGYLGECGYNIHERLDARISYDSPSDVAIQIASKRPTKDDQSEDPVCLAMIEKASTYANIDLELEDFRTPRRVMENGLCSIEASISIFSLITLLRRTTLILARQGKFILIRFALHAVVAGVLVALYNRDIGTDNSCVVIDPSRDPRNCSCGTTIDELQKESVSSQNVKFQFFSLLFLMFAALMPTVLTFPSEMKLFLHEYRNGLYSTLTYYITKTIVEIPLQLVFPYLYCCFLYWYSQQPGLTEWKEIFLMTERFRLFFFTTTLCCFIAQGLGFLIGILCVSSFNISIIVSSSSLLFLFLFSGFFVRRNQMGPFATGVTYLSFIRFGFESIIISIFGKERCVSPEESSVMLIFSLKNDEVQFNLIMLGVHLVGMRLLALFFLKNKASKSFLRSFKKYMRRLFGRIIPCLSQSNQNQGRQRDPCGIIKIFKCILWGCLWLFLAQLALGLIAGIIASIINAGKDNDDNRTVTTTTTTAIPHHIPH